MANGLRATSAGEIGAWTMFMYRFSKSLKSPTPYLMLVGFALFFGAWFLLSEVFRVWRFASLPGPRQVLIEWFNPNPVYGMSLYTPDYYMHVWMSLRRVLYAFVISTGLGVPFGLFLGWSKNFREFTFPVFETLRPIPVLAWVPLAIVMFKGDETPPRRSTPCSACSRSIPRTRAPRPAWARAGGRSSATSSSRARCRSSSPACRSRWGWRGSRWWRRRWCRASTAWAI
jgi:hypothetical protein